MRVAAGEARELAARALEAGGFPPDEAALCADAFVESSLRGIDSHGFVTLVPHYLGQVRRGEIHPGTAPEVVEQRGATALVDGRHALGLRTARLAMKTAVELAREHGLGAVTARNVGYLGALWWCAWPAVEAGLVGLAASNSEACVAPHGGREPLHGTNPFAVAVPGEPFPLVVDMRTNEFRMADYWRSVATGEPLAPGLISPAGEPVTELEGVDDAVYLPFGGARGYGLALVVDVLTAALAGAPIGREVEPGAAPTVYSAFFLALDPAFFGPPERFTDAVSRLAGQARATAPLDPDVPVRLPGERGERERRRRERDGIPVDPVLWERLHGELERLGVA